MTKTITMPLEEYEQMQKEIEDIKSDLKKRDVRNFIRWDWESIGHQRAEVWVDYEAIRDYVGKDIRYAGARFVEKNPERFTEKLHTGEVVLTSEQMEQFDKIKNQPLQAFPDKPMNITINCTCNHKSPEEIARELVKNIQKYTDVGSHT
ncbi:hypothetical protein MKZ02_20000 [Pseudobacillus sp. FSL P4-0506]|uniref:hypothetical protein n=1 Tax=Pseudobacillus sp. FSL P4-0506 TaxID=2921576 RepID=UPI0030FBE1ED